MLSQKQSGGECHPIAYASRTLQQSEKNYGITELKALAVLWAVRYFRHYLYGHRCQVITDHEALKALLNTPQPSEKLARWGLIIQELDLTISYRTVGKNGRADAFYHYPVGSLGGDRGREDYTSSQVYSFCCERRGVPAQAGDASGATAGVKISAHYHYPQICQDLLPLAIFTTFNPLLFTLYTKLSFSFLKTSADNRNSQ